MYWKNMYWRYFYSYIIQIDFFYFLKSTFAGSTAIEDLMGLFFIQYLKSTAKIVTLKSK